MSKRINPSPSMKSRLLARNKNVCCVCREHGLGLVFHHIDGNPANTVEENLAVLCVKDHDWHHRPDEYAEPKHLELGADRIIEYKKGWETFVEEAAKSHPKILGVLNGYGRDDYVHSVRLTLQWVNGKVELERTYHLTDEPAYVWIDKILDEMKWLGDGIVLVPMPELLEVDYCPDCAKKNTYSSLHTSVDESIAKKFTAASWKTDSYATIYFNSMKASLDITIFLEEEPVFEGHIHKCKKFIRFNFENHEERIPIPERAVRTQVIKLVEEVLSTWKPSRTWIGTGNPNSPTLIKKLILPKIWENI